MKIIFLKDVPKLGKKDEVKNMNDGYVRNFLLPQKLVEEATPRAMQKLQERLNNKATEKAFVNARLETIYKNLSGKTVDISALANDKDVLFKAITVKDVLPLFEKSCGLDLEENYFNDVHIKTVGEHKLKAQIGDKTANLTLIVKAK